MSAHTPGPWKADPKMLVIKTRSGYTEGPIMSYLAGDANSPEGMKVSIASERHADHYLCAAAPELLEALQAIISANDAEDEDAMQAALIHARAAIAKARGK